MSVRNCDVVVSAPGYKRKWQRIKAVEYRSEDDKWRIGKEGRGKWRVCHRLDENYWEEWGRWEWAVHGKECLPFHSLVDAMASVEEAEYRGWY